MEEKNKILKTKKKLIILLLIYLSIAFMCIGLAFFMNFFNNNEEAINISELILNDNEKEGKYVKIDIDTLPILITSVSEKDNKFYYITDTCNNIYIVNLSSKTFKNIVETLNVETGKLKSTYQLKGITNNMDEQIKKLALSNSYKVFKNNELNLDNFSEYLGEIYVKENIVSDREVTLYGISALLGVFFLVLAFGYIVPAMIKVSKGDFGIFSEKNMKETLEKYIPIGETLIAGIHCIGIEMDIRRIFDKCIYVEEELVPNENNPALEVIKRKYSRHDIFVGITRHNLIISECEPCKHLYEFNNITDLNGTVSEQIKTSIKIEDIGHCFSFTEIQNCTIKNAWMGAVNCSITLKNGTYLKFIIPKSERLGMSNHTEYSEVIIECLSSKNT